MALLSPRPTRRSFVVRLVAIALDFTGGAAAAAPKDIRPPTEMEIRAAFLKNFAAFVEWPTTAFASEVDPIVIGIYGADPFRDFLDRLVENEMVRGRTLVIRRFPSGANPVGCHILFVSDSEARTLPAVLERVRGQPVLTVSSLENFSEKGGMIQLVAERGRIRFKINQRAAQNVRLVLSSRLLRLGQSPGS